MWPNFELHEFECKHCRENKINHRTVDRLQRLRTLLGFPLVVTSGYRCPVHNAAVSTTGATGPHTTGQAIDVAVRGPNALKVVVAAVGVGFTGIGVQQKGATRFIHLDDLTEGRPTIWSY